MKAIDVVKDMQERMASMPDNMGPVEMSRIVTALAHNLEQYEQQSLADAIEMESMNQEQHDDARIQAVAHKFGMTTNQVFGLMDTCDKLNNGTMQGTGLVVVPFWFHQQYVELKNLNEQLTSESENLVQTVKRISDQSTEDLSGYIPERQSIVTGVTAPYIPGVTGPRPGDEHLDPESIYNLHR